MTPGAQPFRLATGGLIDRDRPLSFTFAGRDYQGYAGDSLASALLANGVRVVARSFKVHRPRGVLGAGAEEPNALVQLGRGRLAEPNLRATQVPLTQGLDAWPQNCWPSIDFDLGRAASLVSAARNARQIYVVDPEMPAMVQGDSGVVCIEKTAVEGVPPLVEELLGDVP